MDKQVARKRDRDITSMTIYINTKIKAKRSMNESMPLTVWISY